MFKVLVVGCGGSGAKSLAFMMDQLKTTLAENAPVWFERNNRQLPVAWQFVLVDVPTQPESERAVPNVPTAGGTYISTGSSAGYATVDQAVTDTLGRNNALSAVATWAYPKPGEVTVPTDAGAGQYRGIGRMLILNKFNQVADQLREAKNRINGAEAASQLDAIRSEMGQGAPTGEQSADPVTFVISSMAGGAGASMALDVCRILSGLGLGNYQGRSGLFMVTPDIFQQSGSSDDYIGTNPNALSLFGELSAAQFGEGVAADKQLYEGLGHQANLGNIPVARVFPVGISAGIDAVRIADGAGPSTVYRALGRGLAALITDTSMMQNFIAYQLGNPGGEPFDQSRYAWGIGNAAAAAVPWGSFGYGRLAMGRDRYAEYAAQRLSNSALNQVVSGYADPASTDSLDDQLQDTLNRSWTSIWNKLRKWVPLADPNNSDLQSAKANHWDNYAATWVEDYFQTVATSWKKSRVEQMKSKSSLSSPHGKRGSEWINEIRNELARAQADRSLITHDLEGLRTGEGELYQAVFSWASADQLQTGVLKVIAAEVAENGVAFGAELIKFLRQKLLDSAHLLQQMHPDRSLFLWNEEFAQKVSGQRAAIVGDGHLNRVYEQTGDLIYYIAWSNIATIVGVVLEDFAQNFLTDITTTFRTAHAELNHDRAQDNDPNLGVAQTSTTVPRLWPNEESTVVPDRFHNAANEVMITEPGHYPEHFHEHIIHAVIDDTNRNLRYPEALEKAAVQVAAGSWRSDAGADPAPENLLTLTQPWVPKALPNIPDSTDLRTETSGAVELTIRSADFLDRARQFIARPGYSFADFIDTSLRTYILEAPDTPTQHSRREDIASKFGQAMTKALPLAQINDTLLHQLYPSIDSVRYKFNYSTIPLAGDKEMADRLAHVENTYPYADNDSSNPLGGALKTNGEQRAVDIYGSYPNYLPVVFDSILPAAARQWEKLTLPNARQDYWHMRRARPISAAVPLTSLERRAMINGWYVGRLIGSLIFPGEKNRAQDTDPIHIHDPETQRWMRFDTPLLTPPARMRTSFDWLPALLESLPMAWAKAQQVPELSSLDPYLALRRTWDSGSEPQSEITATSGYDLLREWLHSGQRIGGEEAEHLQVPGTGPEVTAEQRHEVAVKWIQEQGKNAYMLVPTSNLPGSTPPSSKKRELADITDRETAMKVPQLTDIALDVVHMAKTVINALDEALAAGPPPAMEEDFGGFDFLTRSSGSSGTAEATKNIDDTFGSGF